MFVLGSNVSIGNFRFSGVNDVRIGRSMHSLTETAIIKIPSVARIIKNGQANAGQVITDDQFTDGDPVVISLGYNNELQTEFTGFVRYRESGMPLTIQCEGYSWLLRRNRVNISMRSVTVKDYLAAAVKGIDAKYSITIQCQVDIELNNVQVNGTGLDALELLHKYTDGTLTCFFLHTGVLWCGLLYTACAAGKDVLNAGKTHYRPGYNVMKDSTLRLRSVSDGPMQVIYNKKLPGGMRLTGISDVFKDTAGTHNRILNQVMDAGVLKDLANEKAYRANYSGYEGAIETFLQPYAAPGFIAAITDTTYPERNGDYLIESVQTYFGTGGARRIVEIGPRQGFAKTT